MSVAGIVLAAGFSRRLGRPKQSVVLGGKTLLQRTVGTALAAQLSPVIVVVQPETDLPNELGGLPCEVVLNPDAEEGIASSVRAGVHAILHRTEVEGAVLMTCDQVSTRDEHLRALCASPGRLTGSSYAGRVAVPAYFPRTRFGDLLALQGDKGARSLLRDADAITAEDLALDIDTEADVARAMQLFAEIDHKHEA